MTRKMKDSGIEWIGMIPEGWDRIRLRYLCTIETGNMDTQDADSEGIYPFYVRSPNIEKSSKYTFQGEGIIVAGDGVGAGRVFHHAFGEYGVHQRCYRLSNFNGINPDFLFYYISNMFPNIMDYGSAQSTVPSIRLFMLQDFPVYIPLRTTQPRIVAYLDAKCAEIDALIAAKEKSNALLKEYRQSIIFEAVTKGLDPNAPMKDSGIEWIGMIPEGWRLERLKYHAVLNPNIVLPSLSDDSDVTFIPMDHLKKGYHMKSTTTYEKVKKGYVIFENNDILMAKVTPCLENGNLAIASQLINGIGFGSTEINVIRCKCIENKHLYYLLQCDGYINKATYEMYGVAGLKRLDPSFIPNSLIPIPPQSDQQRIVSFLDAKCAEIDALIAANDKTISQLREYRQSVIFEAVTGKMEV